jgi:phage I-like protein
MVPDDGGDWYAKDEADAVIRELGELVDSWMNSATTRAHQLNAAEKRIAELEAERDAARADAESNRVNTERYECMRDKYLSRWIEKEKIDALIDKARGVTK